MTDTAVPQAGPASAVHAGSTAELMERGYLTTKVDHVPVVVFALDGNVAAIEDRCPHMGFPLHRGTVDSGLVTCHWHHARFDLASGCTLDPWADDARAFDAEERGGEIWVRARPQLDVTSHLQQRLREGLEDGLTLVVAKSVLGLLDAGAEPREIVRTGVEFGLRNRNEGWGAGLTVLVAMARVLPYLDDGTKALALVHGLTFLAGDTRGHPPRFDRSPIDGATSSYDLLTRWYRQFVDTRSTDAAERTLTTAIRLGDLAAVEAMMGAAVTDHVFVDGGHTVDFTNKAFEAVELLGRDVSARALPSLVRQTVRADRSEETSAWRHPHDLAALIDRTNAELPAALTEGAANKAPDDAAVASLAERIGQDDPEAVTAELTSALRVGTTLEQAGRAVALAAAQRIVRFHTQNEHSDWNTVHHTFTYANALHQSLRRTPTAELARGLVHGALKVYLDRFLNVPPARLPQERPSSVDELSDCWNEQGQVGDAAAIAYSLVRRGEREALVAALGRALVTEDAGFHWYQLFEAAVTQSEAWPEGSTEQALVLAAFARFLAAHTPTRREQTTTFQIAQRLRRGDNLFEET